MNKDDIIYEKVLAGLVERVESEPVPRGFLERAIHEGVLKGFKQARDTLRVKRLMREDARRLYKHVEELIKLDIGDDDATAYEIKLIADRLKNRYNLIIGKDK